MPSVINGYLCIRWWSVCTSCGLVSRGRGCNLMISVVTRLVVPGLDLTKPPSRYINFVSSNDQ